MKSSTLSKKVLIKSMSRLLEKDKIDQLILDAAASFSSEKLRRKGGPGRARRGRSARHLPRVSQLTAERIRLFERNYSAAKAELCGAVV